MSQFRINLQPSVIKTWDIEAMTGYKPQTTFYEDFSIADRFGVSAVKDTYRRCFRDWKDDYVYLTELVMALNWKIWEHYETNEELAKVYDKLYWETNDYAYENLKGDELNYFIRITD